MYARIMAARRQSAPVKIDSTDNLIFFISIVETEMCMFTANSDNRSINLTPLHDQSA